MPTPPRRSLLQISLAEWLILTTLLGIAWWQCAWWPVNDTGSRLLAQPGHDPDDPFDDAHLFAHVFEDGALVERYDFQRPPMRYEVFARLAVSSAAIIGVWLVGSIAVRAILRRRPTQS